MKKDQKKNSHLKAKVITVLVLVIALIGIGIYFGVKLQRNYYSMLFNLNQHVFSIVLWSVIAILIVVALLVMYFYLKIKNKNKH